jgi:hypothetical protein
VLPALKGIPVQCVIGLLQGEYLCGYAAWLSNQLKTPLFYFYHDRGELLHHARNPVGAKRIKSQNLRLLSSPQLKRVWTVTPELVYDAPGLAGKFATVYPIAESLSPESMPKWNANFSRPVLAHAGSLYNEVLAPLSEVAVELRKAGGRLLIFTHLADNAEKLRAAFPDVVSYEGDVSETTRLCGILQERTSGFIVAYPQDTDQMAWSLDCFPSKLTQLVQTGLPGLILAPSTTALGRWSRRNHWSLYCSDYAPASLQQLIEQLSREESWTRAATESRHAAGGDFNPTVIADIVNSDIRQARS